jgi:hypothetical protein
MIKRLICLAALWPILVLGTSGYAPKSARGITASYTQKNAPDMTALAAIVFPGVKGAPSSFGVYLGHGLVLTNWHPWTQDGRFFTLSNSPLSPSRQVRVYDDDGVSDPGESVLSLADCSDGSWVPAAGADPACVPFARFTGAGFIFPLVGDTPESTPVPVERLIYASRDDDIALFAVDALSVEARGVTPARLSMVPASAEMAVLAADQPPLTLITATPALLPPAEGRPSGRAFYGPWRVPSLVLSAAVPDGTPIFDPASGDLIGLVWRTASDNPAQAWVTPAVQWFHDLYTANDQIQGAALAAVLSEATPAPVDGSPTLNDPLTPELGNGGIDVQHVTLDLAFDIDSESLSGVDTLDIRATDPQLRSFTLDSYGPQVESVAINGTDAPFVAKEQKLLIQLPDAVRYGTVFQVTIRYHAAPQPYRSPYIPFFDIGMFFTGGKVSTLNEPDAARTWFPCNDHPSDRATYDFRLRVPQPLTAVANGQLIETIPNDDGTQTFHWQMDRPMATYLVTVAIAEYATISDETPDGIPITDYVYPDRVEEAREIFGATDEAMTFLENLIAPYPFETYGQVVAPVIGMALETQTMTTMPDVILDGTPLEYYGLIVHELAHQWFGNTVTLGNWSDIWLNEGFATFSDWMSREARFGSDAALAVRSASEQTLISDKRLSPLVDPDPAEMFGVTTYDKGTWVLYMLRQEIGDETFSTLLRTYYETMRDRPTDTLTFWQIAEAVTGRDLSVFFTQWLLQGGLPRYTLYWTERGSGADVLLCPTAPGDYRLSLTLRFTANGATQDAVLNLKEGFARAGFPLDFTPANVIVDPDQAVLAQIQVQPIAELPGECPMMSG